MIKNNYWNEYENILSGTIFKSNSDRNFSMNSRMIQLILKLFIVYFKEFVKLKTIVYS